MTRTKLSDVVSYKSNQTNPTNLSSLIDRHFNLFDELFNDSYTYTSNLNLPYNTILIDDNTYRIELALAGYTKNDIDVYVENDRLYVEVYANESSNADKSGDTESATSKPSKLNVTSYPHFIHKGISKKYMKLYFGVPKNYKTFTADFSNGMLTINIMTAAASPTRQSIPID